MELLESLSTNKDL